MADYPNPFVPAPSTPLATSGMADYPDPFAPALVSCPTLANTNVAVCLTSNSVYHTVDGTFFKIQCGYHHGTTAVQITTAPSLQKCIDKCSQENSCNSVNYIPSSLGCTLISSTGTTTVSEASAGQDYAYKIASPNQPARDEGLVACSTACPSANGQSNSSIFGETFRINCGKSHSNTRPDGSNNLAIVASYPTFDPAKSKTDRLQYSGTTPRIGFGSSTPIYGNAPANLGLTTVKHRAYIFAQQSGTYTFRIPFVDDVSLLWVGPAAYPGYTRSNTNIVQLQTGVPGAQTAVAYMVVFEEGKYYPMRVIWANGAGAGGMSFELKGPDGKVIVSSDTTEPSRFMVQYSCDETTAPRFPPFGSET